MRDRPAIGTRSAGTYELPRNSGARQLVATTDDGTKSELKVLTYDVDRDIALLQAQSTIPEPAPVKWADDLSLQVGEEIIVIGYPFPGSQSIDDCSESITTTGGLLSAAWR